MTSTVHSAVVYSTIITVTVVGNVLVLAAVTTNKILQRPCNIFLASLACADLGVSLSHSGFTRQSIKVCKVYESHWI